MSTSSAELSRTQLARNLVLARSALTLTQDTLATSSGVSRATIAQLESASTDCRMSTLTDISAALSISPMLLLLREPDIHACAKFLQKTSVDRILSNLPAAELKQMWTLRDSGLQRNLLRVGRFGIAAARAAGFDSSGAAIGASIGSVLLPGLGTAVGAVFGSVLGKVDGIGSATHENGSGI